MNKGEQEPRDATSEMSDLRPTAIQAPVLPTLARRGGSGTGRAEALLGAEAHRPAVLGRDGVLPRGERPRTRVTKEVPDGETDRIPLPLLLLALASFFSGFINLLPKHVEYPATLIIDGTTLLMALRVVSELAGGRMHVRRRAWMSFLLATIVFMGVEAVLTQGEGLANRLSSWRSHALYAIVAIYVVNALTNRRQVERVLNLCMTLFAAFALFGCLQFLFRSQLPEWLLVSKDTNIFGYYGTNIVRSTGLMGNTIVFGSVMNLAYALHLTRFAHRPSWKRFIVCVIVFAGGVTTFSRVTIVINAGLTLAVPWFVAQRRNAGKAIAGSLLAVALAIPAIALLLTTPLGHPLKQSFIVSKLFSGDEVTSSRSTATHEQYIEIARQVISQHPVFGVGIGTQIQTSDYGKDGNVVVTDGAVWTTLMEGGYALGVIYFGLLATSIWYLRRAWRENPDDWLPLALMIFAVPEFCFASIYNSGFYGKGPFVLFWLLFGLAAAGREIDRRATRFQSLGN